MKIGPLQERWLQSLEQNAERQCIRQLAKKNGDGSYQACCLGEAAIIAGIGQWGNEQPKHAHTYLVNGDRSELADDAFEALGLRGPLGNFQDDKELKVGPAKGVQTLSDANDGGATWPEIAAFIRANPGVVFEESK